MGDRREAEDDELDTPFKRRVVLLVVAITVLASAIELLRSHASAQSAKASRETRQLAIQANALQQIGQAEFDLAHSVYLDDYEAELRANAAFGSVASYFSRSPEEREDRSAEQDLWAGVQSALEPLSPLLRPGRFQGRSPFAFLNETQMESRRVALRRDARTETRAAWSRKDDRYVALLTVIAVALILLGLSLATQRSRLAREALEIPAVGLGAISLVFTLVVGFDRVPVTPEAAIRHVAEGDRLLRDGRVDDAISRYSEAIGIHPFYGTAYGRLAEALLVSGADRFEQTPGSKTFALRLGTPANHDRVIANYEAAARYHDPHNIAEGNLGYAYLLADRYDEAERWTRRAIATDPARALWRLNLGEILAAQGDEREAEDAYATAVDLIASSPSASRSGLDRLAITQEMGAARTGLERVALRQESVRNLVRRLQGRLVAAERELLTNRPVPDAPAGASATGFAIQFDAKDARFPPLKFLGASFDYSNVPEGTQLTFIWWFRRDRGVPWNEMDPPSGHRFATSSGGPSGRLTVTGPYLGDCSRPGEYRVDVYAGSRWIGGDLAGSPPELPCRSDRR